MTQSKKALSSVALPWPRKSMAGRSPKHPHEAEGIMKVGRSVLWIEKKLGSKANSCIPELAWRHVASPDSNVGRESVESNQIDFSSGPRSTDALCTSFAVLKLLSHYCYTMLQRGISAIIGEMSSHTENSVPFQEGSRIAVRLTTYTHCMAVYTKQNRNWNIFMRYLEPVISYDSSRCLR